MDQSPRPPEASDRRLDSWKEIATFFGRDERTVRRWEKERSLPVYRMPGKARGSVYSFTSELAQWLKTPNFPAEELEGAAQRGSPDAVATGTLGNAGSWTRRRTLSFAFVIVVAVALVLGIGWFVRRSALIAAEAPGAYHTPKPEALDLYLKGRFEWSKRTPESLNKAVDYFTQAIVRDSNYAQAYAGLADSFNLLREYTVMPDREAYPRAIAAAKKALELDDSLSEAHRALAFGSFYWTWDFSGAEREFKRAIDLDPKDADAHHWYANSLLVLGRFNEALSQIEQARQLDPTSISILSDNALALWYSHREDESKTLFNQIENSDPKFLSPHRYRAAIALATQDFQTYLAESKKTMELTHDAQGLEISSAAEQGFATGGSKGLLNGILRVEKKYYKQGLIPGYFPAQIAALLGQKKDALLYLEEDFKKHEASIIGARVDACFNSLHDDPEFHNLVVRIGLPPL